MMWLARSRIASLFVGPSVSYSRVLLGYFLVGPICSSRSVSGRICFRDFNGGRDGILTWLGSVEPPQVATCRDIVPRYW